MHIDTYYKHFWAEAIQKFNRNEFEYDPLLDGGNDTRFGLTVIIRPSEIVLKAIDNVLNEFRAIEADQYYYPPTDMHVTVLSVISCYKGFSEQSFTPEGYIEVIRKSLENIHPFKIHFQGITASPGCIMVQGYPEGELNLLRTNLRDNFKNTGLETSFDKRYILKVAHSTVLRFKNKITQSKKFIKKLEQFRHYEFGTSMVNEVEFVFNDWYLRKDKGRTLATFNLT